MATTKSTIKKLEKALKHRVGEQIFHCTKHDGYYMHKDKKYFDTKSLCLENGISDDDLLVIACVYNGNNNQ